MLILFTSQNSLPGDGAFRQPIHIAAWRYLAPERLNSH